MRVSRAVAALSGWLLTSSLAACGASHGGATAASTPSSPAVMTIVGQWTAQRDCHVLDQALLKAGLAAVAPAVLQDFFTQATPQQLAKKSDICVGAGPAVTHSHFFTAAGAFGSLDENGQQVDDGTYSAQAPDLYICDSGVPSCTATAANGHFKYAITNDQLRLTPVITKTQRAQALAHPFDFSHAGWMVAVAYPGRLWTRTACSVC